MRACVGGLHVCVCGGGGYVFLGVFAGCVRVCL